ncbi:protein kinase domain-containing protein [Streptomyces sp. IBSBF 3010]|uniref:protein kinase domain-containing protein n=1 Tax=Streptomyces sp. IBSBF 3010 TaxID=2903526 RepID=UPI002FDBC6CC
MEALKPTDPQQVGRYRIAGLLGAGGMGRVYMGRSPSGRLVAVKVVRPELADDPGFRRRFAREVAAARKVTGFFTAALVDADPDGSPPWLATAYVPGMALDQAVAAHGPWPVASVRALGAGLAEALEAIHEAGLIHRDLKPSNVLIAPDGPRVVDFGISVAAEATVLTHAGTAVGTPGFMSPEQLTGDAVTAATDVFALGAVLTYAATGTGPFGTGSAQSLNFRIAYEKPRLEGLPGRGLEIVARCLAKEPVQRPGVNTLIRELADMMGDASYTPTQIVTDTAAWLPEQVAAAVLATVTSAAVPAPVVPSPAAPAPAVPAPGATRGPRKAPASPRKPARPKPTAAAPVPEPSTVSAEPQRRAAPGASPAGPRKTVAEGAKPAGPRKATQAGASPTPPRKAAKAPSARPALASETAAAATPVAPAALPHLWTVRRVLFLSVACIAFVLALCLPFGYNATVFGYLISDWWPWWTSDWPFGGTWPFVVVIGLALTSCVAVLVQLRRFPTGPVPRPARRLHYLATSLAGGLLALYIYLGLHAEANLSFLESGQWFYVLGCLASLAGTVRLKGPKSGGSAA